MRLKLLIYCKRTNWKLNLQNQRLHSKTALKARCQEGQRTQKKPTEAFLPVSTCEEEYFSVIQQYLLFQETL